MEANCTNGGKFISSRWMYFLLGAAKLKYLLLFLVIFLGCINGRIINAWGSEEDFEEYINKDDYKHYKNGLFLGMFTSQNEADDFLYQNTINPITKEKYDFVIAFGMSGNAPWVKIWELRVVGDNLSWSPLTNYEKIKGLKFDYLVAHSSGNDIASNAIKMGYTKVKHFISFAPPAGFNKEVKNLPVNSVEIYRTKGDPVAEVLGKQTVFGVLQKLGDLDLGILKSPSGKPYVGGKVTMSLPDKIVSPRISETIFDGDIDGGMYIMKNPHDYNTVANNVVIKSMYNIKNADTNSIHKSKLESLNKEFEFYHLKFPLAAKRFNETITLFSQEAGQTQNNIGTSKLPDHNINSFPDTKIKQQDEIYKRAARGPFPPDKPGGAGIPSANYRISSSAIPENMKRSGVIMKADVVKGKQADTSEMFGIKSSSHSETEIQR